MIGKIFKLIYILLHPILFLFCFVVVPLFLLYSIDGLNELKKLEGGASQIVTAKVTNWQVGRKSRPGTRNSRYPYGVRYEFIPVHLYEKEDSLVKSSTFRGISRELWDETRVTKKVDVYYLIDNPENHQIVGWLSPTMGDYIASILCGVAGLIMALSAYIRIGKILTIDGFKNIIGWTLLLELLNINRQSR